MARKINPNAKRWKKIKEKQLQVNRMITESRNRLGKEHSAYKQATAKRKQFYKSRGYRIPSQFSMKPLSVKDMKDYENLLDSILNSTYLNKEKYEKYHKQKVQDLIDSGLADDEKTANAIYDIMNEIGDILEELGIPFSEFAEFMNEKMNEYNLEEKDFEQYVKEFAKMVYDGLYEPADFFDIIERAIEGREQIEILKELKVPLYDIYDYLGQLSSAQFYDLTDAYLDQYNEGEGDYKAFMEGILNG